MQGLAPYMSIWLELSDTNLLVSLGPPIPKAPQVKAEGVMAPKAKALGKPPKAKANGKAPKAKDKGKARKAKANGKAPKANAKSRSGTGPMVLLQRLRDRAEKAETELKQRIPEPRPITITQALASLAQLSRPDIEIVIARLRALHPE